MSMNVIDEVKARLDIVNIVSETVTLRKSGRNYTGFCPFHSNTKTPSFVVFPETQTWRCFGACAEGGDLFSYVSKREGFDFRESLEYLAKRAGVELKPLTPQAEAQDEHRNKLLELNKAAATYFHELLTRSPAGAEARAYLEGRGLNRDTIAQFQLGYALDQWDALIKHLTAKGYTFAELAAAGLVVERENSPTGGYDRFRNRLMIPIRDVRGRVIGFGARALAADELAKYINSPQTELFDKSATLYGLDLARKYIRQADQAVIVEGYMDVIQAHQHGIQNVVAQMGTALTEEQLKLLKRTTGNLVLALDSDAAGNAATLRGLNVAREALDREAVPVPTARGLIRFESRLDADIRIVHMPPGKDPDDIIKEGVAEWQALVDSAMPVIDFYFEAVTKPLDLDSAKGKSTAVRELIPVLRDIGDAVERQHYIQKLARLIHIDERTLLAEMQGQQQPKSKRKPQPTPSTPETEIAPPPVKKPVGTPMEIYCLSLVIANPGTLALANAKLEGQALPGLNTRDFKGGDNRELFKAVARWTAQATPTLDALIAAVEAPLEGYLATLLAQWHQRPSIPLDDLEQDLTDSILRLRLQSVNEQISELTFLQKEAMQQKDIDAARQYAQIMVEYMQQRKKLEKARDTFSLMGQRRIEEKLHGSA